jgi:rod shape-determining protein MreD
MRRNILDGLLTLGVLILQTTLVQYMAIGGLMPDLLLLWIVAVAVRRGQVPATVIGFCSGLALDLLSGNDGMLGLAALAKTVGGFLAGYFYNENKILQTLSSYRFVLIVLLTATVHNLIYFIIFLQGSEVSWWGSVLFYGIPTALYTAAVCLIPMFIYARKALS